MSYNSIFKLIFTDGNYIKPTIKRFSIATCYHARSETVTYARHETHVPCDLHASMLFRALLMPDTFPEVYSCLARGKSKERLCAHPEAHK